MVTGMVTGMATGTVAGMSAVDPIAQAAPTGHDNFDRLE